MSFEDDIRQIYQKEKKQYGIKMAQRQQTYHPEYDFKTFEEWKKDRGYNYK